MFPGKILKLLNAKGFKIVQMVLVNTISYRFNGTGVQSHEEHVKNRCNDMKMLSQRKETQKKEKGYIMHKIRSKMGILQGRLGRIRQNLAEKPGNG